MNSGTSDAVCLDSRLASLEEPSECQTAPRRSSECGRGGLDCQADPGLRHSRAGREGRREGGREGGREGDTKDMNM